METVRSRCMTVVLSRGSGSVLPEETPEVQQLHAAALAQASEFAAALVQEDELALYLACIQWEKLKRPEAAAFLMRRLHGCVRRCWPPRVFRIRMRMRRSRASEPSGFTGLQRSCFAAELL